MGTRGYHSYRGRGSTGKKVLAIVLGVILVAAGAFLLLQNRYVVYDENGNAHWELPFGKNKDDGGTPMPDDVVIVREEPQRPQLTELHAQLLTENALRRDAQTVLSQHPDALVIDVKLRDGTVTYQTSVDGGQYVTVGDESSLENLRTLLQSDRWTVARISALADHAYAKARRDETALRREDGGLWYDYDSMCWLDPNKPETQQYLADLCAECASLGFDEILLDQFTYPTVGRLDRLQTGDVEKTAVLAALTVRLREAIPKATALSIELHSDPVADTDKSGLTLELVTGSFDRIYLDTADLPLATLQGELPADYDQTVRFVPLVKQAEASGSYLQTN